MSDNEKGVEVEAEATAVTEGEFLYANSFRMSDKVDLISAAMAKAYHAMDMATKDATNPFFRSKYADLSSIDRAIRPALSSNEIFIMQTISKSYMLGFVCVTRLMHSSGQWIDSDVIYAKPEPYKNEEGHWQYPNSQHFGSAQTYARRYGLMAAVGLAVSDGSDDDGEATTNRQSGKQWLEESKGKSDQRNSQQSTQRTTQRSTQQGTTQQNKTPEKASVRNTTGGNYQQLKAKYKSKLKCPICSEFCEVGDLIAYASDAPVEHWVCHEKSAAAKAAPAKAAPAKAEPAKTSPAKPVDEDDDLPF